MLGIVLVMAACGPGDTPAPPPGVPAPRAPDAQAIVARVGGEPVTAGELDRGLQVRLHDLDVARYEMRAARLDALLRERIFGPSAAAAGMGVDAYVRREAEAAGLTHAAFVAAAFERAGVDVLLAPPPPPVMVVSAGRGVFRGPNDAPVTIVEFCDYQSPHCRRMQPVLRDLLAAYPTQVRLAYRDFPQPLHRDAVRAAEAAQCAGAQGRYWDYHDVLFQERADLGRTALAGYAQRLGLDVPAFVACLDGGVERAAVETDAADARRLGLGAVPTTFVDGRYLRGPQPYDALRRQVDAALARLGVPSQSPPSSTAPRQGAPLGTPAPAAAITLPRAEVGAALSDRAELLGGLETAGAGLAADDENRRLVRVGPVRAGSLFDAMGLRAGDVVVRVNGVPVLDGGEALSTALAADGPVTVELLRNGLPQRFEYRVE